jgi:hypothetical protein
MNAFEPRVAPCAMDRGDGTRRSSLEDSGKGSLWGGAHRHTGRAVSTDALADEMTFLRDSKPMAPCFGSSGERQEEQQKLFPSPLRLDERGAVALSQRT